MELREGSQEALYQIMLARYYSSGLARFLAVDPGNDTALEDPQSWNKYAYVRNNPLVLIDPDGRLVVYADKYSAKTVEKAMTVSPGLKQAIGMLSAASNVKVVFKKERIPNRRGGTATERTLGLTLSKPNPTDSSGTFKAVVLLDKTDIVKSEADQTTVVIHEVLGHVLANFEGLTAGMSESDREALAEEITKGELNRIPEEDRPKPLPRSGRTVIGGNGPGRKAVLVDGVDVTDPYTGN